MERRPKRDKPFERWKKEKLRLEKIERKLKEKEEEEEQKKIEEKNKILEVKRLNKLAIEEFCKRENYVQSEKSIHGILSKTEIEILVRYAYKLHKNITDDSSFYIIDRVKPMSIPELISFQDINRISLLERYLKATPQIYKLVDLREYLKGDRRNKKILSVLINDFDKCNYSHPGFHYYDMQGNMYHKNTDSYLFDAIQHLLRDRVLLIAYIDRLKNENTNKNLYLEWNLNETQIIYLYNQFVEHKIINENIRLGLFYQIFNNQVSDFEKSIQINSTELACFLFWSREKSILLNKQPFKIIENLKIFCNAEGKPITAHNLNRYVSEYKTEFIECTKPVFKKIKKITDTI